MTEQAKVPAIRFAGFTDPWEQRKLGELITELSSGKSVNSEKGAVGPSDIGILKTSCVSYDMFDPTECKRVVDAETRMVSCPVEAGTLIVSRMNTPDRVGACGFVPGDRTNLFLPDRLWKVKLTPEVDPYLIFVLLVSASYKARLKGMASGTSGSMHNIPKDSFGNLDVTLPRESKEQRTIGSMFEQLDNLITLHQRKYDKLVVFKKSMLEKMFPKDGESVPEIRFAGFTDPWEQRKLGEFGSVAMCKRIYKEQTSEQGDVPFFKIGTFGADPDAFISNELFEDYKRTYPYPTPGTLLISAAGSIGRIVEYQGEKAYFQDSNIVWLEHEHRLNDAFLKPLYSKIEWGLEGSTIKRLYNKDLLSAEVTIPDGREQKEIGQFFAKLDDLITLHQRKLELLRNIKKSLLDKMFV